MSIIAYEIIERIIQKVPKVNSQFWEYILLIVTIKKYHIHI